MSKKTFWVSCPVSVLLTSLTWRFFHRRFALGTGTATRSRRFIVTPGLFSGRPLPFLLSFHLLSPTCHKARACRADVFPELFGPMNTTGLPRSTSTSPKRLKFRILIFVSIQPSTSQNIVAPWRNHGVSDPRTHQSPSRSPQSPACGYHACPHRSSRFRGSSGAA